MCVARICRCLEGRLTVDLVGLLWVGCRRAFLFGKRRFDSLWSQLGGFSLKIYASCESFKERYVAELCLIFGVVPVMSSYSISIESDVVERHANIGSTF